MWRPKAARSKVAASPPWAGRWLPIVSIFQMQVSFLKPGCFFFYSSAENSDGGHAEFLARRLEEYQRTLRVIYGRVRESDQENQLTQDFNAGNWHQITITCNTLQ